MANEILAFWMPGIAELLVVVVILLITFVLPIVAIVWIIRSLVRNKKENQRLRLEVGKLADELERARKQNEEKGD